MNTNDLIYVKCVKRKAISYLKTNDKRCKLNYPEFRQIIQNVAGLHMFAGAKPAPNLEQLCLLYNIRIKNYTNQLKNA